KIHCGVESAGQGPHDKHEWKNLSDLAEDSVSRACGRRPILRNLEWGIKVCRQPELFQSDPGQFFSPKVQGRFQTSARLPGAIIRAAINTELRLANVRDTGPEIIRRRQEQINFFVAQCGLAALFQEFDLDHPGYKNHLVVRSANRNLGKFRAHLPASYEEWIMA